MFGWLKAAASIAFTRHAQNDAHGARRGEEHGVGVADMEEAVAAGLARLASTLSPVNARAIITAQVHVNAAHGRDCPRGAQQVIGIAARRKELCQILY